MSSITFKISSHKFLRKTKNGYVFTAPKKSGAQTFSIPKSQVLEFTQLEEFNDLGEKEHWLKISVTQYIWVKANLDDRLKHYQLSSEVIIEHETRFGINWDFVIRKRKNINSCYFCHGKLGAGNRTKDHLISKMILKACGIKGGVPNNTVPCCLECNKEKKNMHPEVFLKYVRYKISKSGEPRYRVILFTLEQTLKIK